MISYNWVTGRLATGGGIATKDDLAALLRDGTTAIIDCCESDDTAVIAGTDVATEIRAHASVSYLWNPTPDDGAEKGPEWFGKSLKFALPLLIQPHQKIYIHCAQGINRGPSTLFAVLLALQWATGAAEGAIRAVRPMTGLRYKANAIAAIEQLGYSAVLAQPPGK